MSSQSYPLSLRDSSDYIRYKKSVLINNETQSGKKTNPTWISSTIEYKNLYDEGQQNCSCLIPDNPDLDYDKSRQEFGSYADNTYLTDITVNWKRTNYTLNYKVFLIELQSSNTLIESDEIKSAPASFIKQIGSSPPYTYELQYSYESELLGVNTLTWKKAYLPSQRIAKVFAFVYAYGKFGNPNPTLSSQPSIRYSVFDVKPLIPLNTSPLLNFTTISGTRNISNNITTISIKWLPLNNAVYYRVFLIEGSSTPYVQTQSKFLTDPQRYDNSGILFTSGSSNLNNTTFEFEKTYTSAITKITAFVYGFDASNVPCPFPGRCVTFDSTLNLITVDYTLNSPNNGINYFLNEDGSSSLNINPTLPLPHLETKSFL